jgi:hypothetical protein
MNAKEFNELWHKIAEKELLPAGFIRNGNSYLTIQDTVVFQFSKSSQKTSFTGFLYGYTHSFLEIWTNEFPQKWPLALEQLMLVFSKETLNHCANVGIKKGAVLSLEYSNGKKNLSSDFPIVIFEQWSKSDALKYIEESVLRAKIDGLNILKELNPMISIELLSGKVKGSFMPEKWLEMLKKNNI